jgi:hypothetical protein
MPPGSLACFGTIEGFRTALIVTVIMRMLKSCEGHLLCWGRGRGPSHAPICGLPWFGAENHFHRRRLKMHRVDSIHGSSL